MPSTARTFRIFVSSTFEDLKEERNALQRNVFPALRNVCEQHGARFQAIDLRWGVRDEAALDQKTVEICFREIARCQRSGIKPNFIILLGQRYGWRPLPSRIEALEFENVRDHIAAGDDRNLANDWYRRDDNAVPPEYLLRPRFGEWVDATRWQELEAPLHLVLLDAARTAGLSGEALVKYEASATHQEILKGIGATLEDRRHVFVFCRNVPDYACDSDLVHLKTLLRAHLPAENILSYDPADFAPLCQDVERTLRAVIEIQAGTFGSRSALALEIDAHDAFARERALVFGREEVLDTIAEYLEANDRRPFVLHGPSGSGKSAVMAQASERALSIRRPYVVIRRFLGASPESSSGLTLLRSLCAQIAEAYGATRELPVNFNGLAADFREELALATPGRPLVIFLDAVDQLGDDDPARSLVWLAAELPPYCRVVISTTSHVSATGGFNIFDLSPLTKTAASAAIDEWFEEAHRSLLPPQRNRLLAAFGRCGLPLYLRLGFEEARGWTSFQTTEECPLGEGVQGIIDTLLERLSLGANHGSLLVRRSLGYLTAARFGLSEDEILDLLAEDSVVWEDFRARAHHDVEERRLPIIVWSRLYLDLEPYLTERSAPGGIVITCFHTQIAEGIVTRYLAGEEGRVRHAALARYFGEQRSLFAGGHVNTRRATELVDHQIQAGLLDDVTTTLTDLHFITAKCAGDLIFDLTRDYRKAIAALPEAQPELQEEERVRRERIRWAREIYEYSSRISHERDRSTLQKLQTFARRLLPGESAGAALVPPRVVQSVEPWSNERIHAETRRVTETPTRLDRLRVFCSFVERESHVLVAHGKQAGFVLQHAWNDAPRGPVHDAVSRHLPAAGSLMLLRQWSPGDTYNPKAAFVRRLGHGSQVLTPDGRQAVGIAGQSLMVWDVETGTCLREVKGLWDVREIDVTADGSLAERASWDIRDIAVTADGRRLLSVDYDGTLKLWDLEAGRLLRMMRAPTGWLPSGRSWQIAMSADGRRAASGGSDRMLRFWDLESATCISIAQDVDCIAMTVDGARVVTASAVGLKLWDAGDGQCLQTLPASAASVALSGDGRFLVSAEDAWRKTNSVKVWDLETGEVLHELEGVAPVMVTADGQHAASGSSDQSLKLWDLRSGACVRALTGEVKWIRQMTPDGQFGFGQGGLWDLQTGASIDAPVDPARFEFVESVLVVPNEERAVTGHGKYLKLWDTERMVCLGRIYETEGDIKAVTSHGQRVLVSTGGSRRSLELWDLKTRTCLYQRDSGASIQASRTCAATEDGRLAILGAQAHKNIWLIWDLQNGSPLRSVEGCALWLTCVAVSENGRRAIVGEDPGYGRQAPPPDAYEDSVRALDIQSGKCLHSLRGHQSPIEAVAITPDGSKAMSASYADLRLWDVETGACLQKLEGPTGSINIITMSSDGCRAVTVGRDGTLTLWDIDKRKCLLVAQIENANCSAVAVSSDFNKLTMGTSSGGVVVFHVHNYIEDRQH